MGGINGWMCCSGGLGGFFGDLIFCANG